MKKSAKATLCLVLAVCMLLSACGAGPMVAGTSWQKQYDLGVRYLEEGNYEEAIIAFTAAIEVDPKQAVAYVCRGDAYVLSGETAENLDAAQADYEKAIALDSTVEETYEKLANVYIAQGDVDSAMEILRAGIDATASPHLQQRMDELASDNIKVELERRYRDTDFAEYAVITAKDEMGTVQWEYTTATYEGTELSLIEEIGRRGNVYYYNESGTIKALRISDGKALWENSDFQGASISCAFGTDALYICGYYGPSFYAMTYEGETLKRIESFDDRCYWPSAITIEDDVICVHLDADESGNYSEGGHIHYLSTDGGYTDAPNATGTWR